MLCPRGFCHGILFHAQMDTSNRRTGQMYSISRSDSSFISAPTVSWIHSIVIICYAMNLL